MIIKQPKGRKYSTAFYLWFLPLFLAGAIYAAFPGRSEEPLLQPETPIGDALVFHTDLETFVENTFLADSFQFEGADLRTTDFAHSGLFSIALDQDHVYGLTTWFIPPNKEATYHVSIYRYNPDRLIAPLVIAGSNSDNFYITQQEGIYENTDSIWEIVHATFQVPPEVDSIKLYCFLSSKLPGKVYFDDFNLSISDLGEIRVGSLPVLDLQLEEEGLRKLEQKRLQAWDDGVLVAEEDDWVKARLIVEGVEKTGKIRLKGDWLDHLRGNNWSFRVKLKDPASLWGMIEFNLQKPDTRGLMQEWIYHQLLDHHDILSPRYRFLILRLNGESRGIYACEEHFQKELVESSNRREGPILKFSEDRMWDGVKRQFDDLGNGQYVLENDKQQAYNSAPVEVFDPEVVSGNSDLAKVYSRGLYLMNQYKNKALPMHQIFDVERVGKYLAIVDLCRAYHSLSWHNQRWYYNPLSDRLEPIGFDGFTTDEPKLSPGLTLLAEEAYRGMSEKYEPYKQLFNDPQIASTYIQYLDSFSSRTYLPSFFESLDSSLMTNALALQEEYKIETFQRGRYLDHASRIRLTIPAYPESIECSDLGSDKIYIINHHVVPVKVNPSDRKRSKIIFPSVNHYSGEEIIWRSQRKSIPFQVLGIDSTYESLVLPFSRPPYLDPVTNKESSHPLLSLLDSTSYLLKGGETDRPIIVPAEKSLLIPEGTHLVLNDSAFLLVQGAITCVGTEEHPVFIESSDGTGALVVRGAQEKSLLEHTIFKHLGRVDRDGYLLTGGVTFYESPVQIFRCTFADNTGEDALNTVRSVFQISDCLFENTAFDAFDSDFCEGTLTRSNFVNTGNDAIDFSGSICSITDCFLERIGDKGVSVGEHSTVQVQTLAIKDANIGVASKDLSVLNIDFISLSRVSTCFTAYQKKASFGPAKIVVNKYEIEKIGRLHLIEQGSTLEFVEEAERTD